MRAAESRQEIVQRVSVGDVNDRDARAPLVAIAMAKIVVIALTFVLTVDNKSRFQKSREIGC